MKRYLIIILFLVAGMASADPIIETTDFLNTVGPPRLTWDYVTEKIGDSLILFSQPSGGALLRLNKGNYEERKYLFCDAPLHRIIIFTLKDSAGVSWPTDINTYGKNLIPPTISFGSEDTLQFFPNYRDSVECFNHPVDIAVTSAGRFYNSELDFIYVLDRQNQRIVKLKYDITLDSLIWLNSFGQNILRFPTAIEVTNYGDIGYPGFDILVTDGFIPAIIKFSSAGVIKAQFAGRGESMGALGYPTGITAASTLNWPNRFYVTDSKNHRVVRYYSESSGPIYAERQYTFPMTPYPYIAAIDADSYDNIYILDEFNHHITVIAPNLDRIISIYGEQGYGPGQFDYPSDIYIDSDEMNICELWADSSGIQSFRIIFGTGKLEPAMLPQKFNLYQNYPNPFNSHTTIMFDIAEPGNVELVIYNILGQKINTLIDQQMQPGTHRFIWDGKNKAGNSISSGIYFYRLTSSDKTSIKKLLLLK